MTTHGLLRYSTTWRYKAFYYLQETLVHETTTCRLPQYSTQAETRSQEKLFIHKMETSKEAWSLHPHKAIAQAKLSQKGHNNSLSKSHIYMTRRRHSTSYYSINFTIWSATGSASSTYLTNPSWSQAEHMPSPRTAIFAEGQYDLTSPRACAT